MAYALRIDDVRFGGGRLHVFYTAGSDPLETDPSGSSVEFGSRADAIEFIADADRTMTNEAMLRLMLRRWRDSDTGLTTRPVALIGRTITADLSGAVKTVTVV